MNRVIITRPFMGLIAMQVCAVSDATDEEILTVCNSENPAGTSAGWGTVVRENSEEEEHMKPVSCEDDLDRKHFIVLC